jgi:DNA repair protein RecO (recombination protein O)
MSSASGRHVVHDEAVCLVCREFSETSLIVVLLCRQTGKVSLLAKGARRPKSPVAIDLLDEGQAVFVTKSEGLGLMNAFSHASPRPALRRDLDRWHVALYFAELANNATTEFNPAEGLYDLLIRALDRTCEATSRDDLAYTLVAGTRKILDWAGYTPQLRQCVVCDREMRPDDVIYFSASQGGVVCRDCEPTVIDKLRLPNRAWFGLRGRAKDRASLALAFDSLAMMLREYMGKIPKLHAACKEIFAADKPKPTIPAPTQPTESDAVPPIIEVATTEPSTPPIGDPSNATETTDIGTPQTPTALPVPQMEKTGEDGVPLSRG